MIQSAVRSIKRLNIIRSISGIQNLLSNTNNNKLNTEEDDEKFCEDLISATKKFNIVNEDTSEAIKINKNLMYSNVHYRLMHYLNCSEMQAKTMVKENGALDEVKPSKLKKSIEHLLENEISAKSIINNPFLLTMDQGNIIISSIQN